MVVTMIIWGFKTTMSWWLIGNHHDSSWEIRACFQQAVLIIFLTMILGYTMIPDIVKLAIEVISRAMWTEIPMVNPLISCKSHGWNFHMFSYLFSHMFSHMFPIFSNFFPYWPMSSHILPHMVLVCPICFPHVSDFSRFSPRFSYMFAICFATFFPHGSHMYPFFLYFPKFSTPNFPRNCHICFPTVSLFFPLFSSSFARNGSHMFCHIFAHVPHMFPIFQYFPSVFPICFPYVSRMFPRYMFSHRFSHRFPIVSIFCPSFFPSFSRFTAIFPTFFRGTDRAPLMVNIASTVAAACRARSSVRPKASKARPRRMGRVGDVKKKNPGEKNSKMITWIYFRK